MYNPEQFIVYSVYGDVYKCVERKDDEGVYPDLGKCILH